MVQHCPKFPDINEHFSFMQLTQQLVLDEVLLEPQPWLLLPPLSTLLPLKLTPPLLLLVLTHGAVVVGEGGGEGPPPPLHFIEIKFYKDT